MTKQVAEEKSGYRITRFGDYVHKGSLKNAVGYRGLIIAIIDRARQDFLFEKNISLNTDAALYFLSPLYKHHLTYIDYEPDLLPHGITHDRLVYQVAKYGIFRRVY